VHGNASLWCRDCLFGRSCCRNRQRLGHLHVSLRAPFNSDRLELLELARVPPPAPVQSRTEMLGQIPHHACSFSSQTVPRRCLVEVDATWNFRGHWRRRETRRAEDGGARLFTDQNAIATVLRIWALRPCAR